MKKGLLIFSVMLFGISQPAACQNKQHWRILKKYVQKDIEVIEANESRLVLYHLVYKDKVRVGLRPCEDCDITGIIEYNRGKSPHRIWTAHAKFWNNPDRPQSVWGTYFRASFLRILRPPSDEMNGP